MDAVSTQESAQPLLYITSIKTAHASTQNFYPTNYLPLLTLQQYLVAKGVILYVKWSLFLLSFTLTVLNVLVFLHKSMRAATSTYVISISLSQIVYIVILVCAYVIEATSVNPEGDMAVLVYWYYFASYCALVVQRVAYLLTCLMSSERLYAIIRPLHVKGFVLVQHPVTFVVVTYLSVAFYHLYLPLQYTIVSKPGGNGSYIQPTNLYLSNKEAVDSASVWGKILFTYTPLLLLFVLNVVTLYCLRRHTARRQALKTTTDEEAAARRERQMTSTILAATACYVLLSLPIAVHSILRSLLPEYNIRGKESNLVKLMDEFCVSCSLLSYGTDFLSFLLLSKRYRSVLCALLNFRSAVRDPRVETPLACEISMTLSSRSLQDDSFQHNGRKLREGQDE